MKLKNGGIYKILNLVNGKIYIGSAVDFQRRFARHKRLLGAKKHPNCYLQNAWDKHWSCSFEFSILQYVENKSELIQNEQIWLDWFKCYEREISYNICRIADNRTGILHLAEAKAKMSATHKGRVKSSEWQAKITASITGKKRDPSVGKAQSKRLKGRKDTDEVRLNKAKGQTGRKHSQESRDKRSAKLKGRLIRPIINQVL